MQTLFLFVSGPLAWIAWAIFVLGSIYRVTMTLREAKAKDQVLLNYVSLRYGLRSILNWSIPFNTTNMRLHPIFTGVAFLFHICFFLLLLFVSAHQVMLAEGFGLSLPSLPNKIADILTVLVLGAGIFFAARRILRPEVNYVTDWTDFVILALVMTPFLTGFLAYHQLGDVLIMTTLHMLSAEALLIAIPFTRLSHMLLAPLTRAYIGSEFGLVRHVKDW